MEYRITHTRQKYITIKLVINELYFYETCGSMVRKNFIIIYYWSVFSFSEIIRYYVTLSKFKIINWDDALLSYVLPISSTLNVDRYLVIIYIYEFVIYLFTLLCVSIIRNIITLKWRKTALGISWLSNVVIVYKK